MKPTEQLHRGGPTDPSHDEELRRGIIFTDISRTLSIVVCALFIGGLGAVPISQAVLERVKGDESVLPDLLKHRPTKESLKQFEEDLEKASYAHEWIQPHLQEQLTRYGRVGNRKATVGREGWLFYKPGVVSVAGPDFLDKDVLETRRKTALDEGEPAVFPDPRPAIVEFHRALQARGITLIVLPVPEKAALEPSRLHGRASGVLPANNASMRSLFAELRAAGILVFDPTPGQLNPASPRFLVQDTHWTAAWMEEVARALATFVMKEAKLPPVARPPWKSVAQPVARVGDIVDMLKLPDDQTLFAKQGLVIHQIQGDDGSPWEPDEKADVLLLGDSFTNIYSMSPMGWGEAAGFGPHLAFAMGRPVDVIAQNDSGAFATRKLLSEALRAGEDRLAGKKVVVWEFASREFAVGDWKPMSYAQGAGQ